MIRLCALCAFISVVAACSDSELNPPVTEIAESSDAVTYDPSTCKTDAEGMVYFALGREVFRRPFVEGMTIRGMPEEERAKLPPRPDPEEPEGCPHNPIWGSNFSISYQYEPANPELYPPDTPFAARSISFIEVGQRNNESVGEYEILRWGLQPSLERDFERIRRTHNSCERLINGLNACRVPSPGREILSWTTAFQADPQIYEAPYGRPFTVSCLAWGAIDQQDCSVSYNYTEFTRISYKFELHELPPMEIIEFDKGLRAKIESMRVPDFRWADE
jgi:hypothetical protein